MLMKMFVDWILVFRFSVGFGFDSGTSAVKLQRIIMQKNKRKSHLFTVDCHSNKPFKFGSYFKDYLQTVFNTVSKDVLKQCVMSKI